MQLTINGTAVAEPAKEGVTITREPVWSESTGRNINGRMVGDIIARKTTVEITWPPLTFSQAMTIINAIESGGAFFPLQLTGAGGANFGPLTVYASSIPRTIYSVSSAYTRTNSPRSAVHGFAVTFIER